MDLSCDDISPSAPNRTVLDADTGRSLGQGPDEFSPLNSACVEAGVERTETWRAML